MALAWKNLGAYPPGHPALAGSLAAAFRAFNELRGPGGEMVLGIAADGILYGPEKIDTTQAQKFAQALYSRRIAVVRMAAETTEEDLERFLGMLSGMPDESSRPMWEALTAEGVVNINLQQVDYSTVRVTDELAPAPPKRESLWDEILHALVAGQELSPKSQQLLSSDIRSVDELSAMMLRYIDSADDSAQFDPDSTFGIRLNPRRGGVNGETGARVAEAIGAHIASATGLRRQLSVQQVIQLLRTMPEPLRGAIVQSIMRPLSSDESAGALLRELASSLTNDEMLEALRHLAAAGTLSSHAMLLLQSLASLEHKDDELPPAPPGLVGELLELFADDDIDRFNPPDHKALLRDTSIKVPRRWEGVVEATDALGTRVETVAPDAIERQLSATIFELLSRHGASRDSRPLLARIETVFTTEVMAGQFADALEVAGRLREMAMETPNEALQNSIDESMARLGGTEIVQLLVDSLANVPAEKAATIHALLDALGAAATRNLLLALSEEENRSRRRRLFDLVCSLGPGIVPEVIHFLGDERWYVVRNMILLLRSVNDRSSLPEIEKLARHPDLRVRLEAIKTLLASDVTVPKILLEEAINDRDRKMAETAIALVGNYGIREAVEPLLQILAGRDWFGARRSLRILAIKALGELAEPAALPRMQHLFSTPLLPWPARSERLAAFDSLSAYPPEVRAAYVERGLRSRDPDIRILCRRLSKT